MTIKLFLFLSSKLCCLCTLVIFQTKNSFGSSPVESRTSKFGPKSQNAQLTTPCMPALINCRYKHDKRYSISGQCSSLTITGKVFDSPVIASDRSRPWDNGGGGGEQPLKTFFWSKNKRGAGPFPGSTTDCFQGRTSQPGFQDLLLCFFFFWTQCFLKSAVPVTWL